MSLPPRLARGTQDMKGQALAMGTTHHQHVQEVKHGEYDSQQRVTDLGYELPIDIAGKVFRQGRLDVWGKGYREELSIASRK